MIPQRKKPDLVSLEAVDFLIKQGVFASILTSIGLLFGLWLMNAAMNSRGLLSMLLPFIFTAVLVLQLWLILSELLRDGINQRKKRNAWLKNAQAGEVTICDSKWEYDMYGETDEDANIYELALKRSPEELAFWVRVSGKTYYRYRTLKTARIFSSRLDPDVFLLEGE